MQTDIYTYTHQYKIYNTHTQKNIYTNKIYTINIILKSSPCVCVSEPISSRVLSPCQCEEGCASRRVQRSNVAHRGLYISPGSWQRELWQGVCGMSFKAFSLIRQYLVPNYPSVDIMTSEIKYYFTQVIE